MFIKIRRKKSRELCFGRYGQDFLKWCVRDFKRRFYWCFESNLHLNESFWWMNRSRTIQWTHFFRCCVLPSVDCELWRSISLVDEESEQDSDWRGAQRGIFVNLAYWTSHESMWQNGHTQFKWPKDAIETQNLFRQLFCLTNRGGKLYSNGENACDSLL